MLKVGIPAFNTVVRLLSQHALDVDYIVYYGQRGPGKIREIAALGKPIYVHDFDRSFWLNYVDPFKPQVMADARAMLDVAQSPWFSTGIGASAEPQAHRNGPYREADDDQLQSRETVYDNILNHGKRLKDWLGDMPLLLENFNYHPTNAYEYICEPDTFSSLILGIDCGVLLDLAHARISAHNMGYADPRDYLRLLPLDRIREIHVTESGWEGDQRVDLHGPIQRDQPELLELLGWVLDHSPAEAVTVELDESDEPTTLEQVALMRDFLGSRQPLSAG